MVGPSGKFPARRVNRFSWMRSPLANYLISQEIVLSFANAMPDCLPRGYQSGNCTAPLASSGKSGFQATSQRKPSRSRKYPAYPPQGAFRAGFITLAPADRASAKTASTSSFDRALWAIENPPNPAPSSRIPASFASSDRGNSDRAIEPHWKNDTPSALIWRSANGDVIGDLLPSFVFRAFSPVKGAPPWRAASGGLRPLTGLTGSEDFFARGRRREGLHAFHMLGPSWPGLSRPSTR